MSNEEIFNSELAPERGKYMPLSIQEEMARPITLEVQKWKQQSPETFQGEEYKNWVKWVKKTVGEGLKGLGVENPNNFDTDRVLQGWTLDWSLILTKEGYPFYKKPASWAVASSLARHVAIQSLDIDKYSAEARGYESRNPKLIGWLIEHPIHYGQV
jgi:hypothetical protein